MEIQFSNFTTAHIEAQTRIQTVSEIEALHLQKWFEFCLSCDVYCCGVIELNFHHYGLKSYKKYS
jgi:hypothetical protein